MRGVRPDPTPARPHLLSRPIRSWRRALSAIRLGARIPALTDAMSSNEYSNLIDFLSGKFSRIDEQFASMDVRFTSVEQRLTRLEVSFEEFRHDVRAIADVGQQNATRLDRIERLIA